MEGFVPKSKISIHGFFQKPKLNGVSCTAVIKTCLQKVQISGDNVSFEWQRI